MAIGHQSLLVHCVLEVDGAERRAGEIAVVAAAVSVSASASIASSAIAAASSIIAPSVGDGSGSAPCRGGHRRHLHQMRLLLFGVDGGRTGEVVEVGRGGGGGGGSGRAGAHLAHLRVMVVGVMRVMVGMGVLLEVQLAGGGRCRGVRCSQRR